MFDAVFDTLSEVELNYVCGWKVARISMKNQLLMTLMKLRTGLSHNKLSEKFNSSAASVSNVVRTWTIAMQDIIFLHEMKLVPANRKKEELNACRIVEQLLKNEIKND